MSGRKPVDTPHPDIYCNGVQFTLSPFDILLQLMRNDPMAGRGAPAQTVGYVRMSLEQAKVFSILLRKALKNHEDAQGMPIFLHPQIYQQMGLSREEDW